MSDDTGADRDMLGAYLRNLHARSGLTLAQLVSHVGLSENTVRRALNPLVAKHRPQRSTVAKVARVCAEKISNATPASVNHAVDQALALYAHSTVPLGVRSIPPVGDADLQDAAQPEVQDAAESASGDDVERRPRRQKLVIIAGTAAVASVAVIAGAVVDISDRHRHGGIAVRWTEITASPARTWSDPQIAGGTRGAPLGPNEAVQVSCRVRGYVVPDHDPWWYRITSSPWKGRFYVTSDACYNNGASSGPLDNGVVVDEQVPLCTG